MFFMVWGLGVKDYNTGWVFRKEGARMKVSRWGGMSMGSDLGVGFWDVGFRQKKAHALQIETNKATMCSFSASHSDQNPTPKQKYGSWLQVSEFGLGIEFIHRSGSSLTGTRDSENARIVS